MARFESPANLPDPFTQSDADDWVEAIKPTSDVIVTDELLITSSQIGIAKQVPAYRKYEVDYTDFATASTTSADYTVVSLGAGAVIEAVKLIVTTKFEGGSVSAATMSVGTTAGTPTEFLSADNVFAVTTTTAAGHFTTVTALTENAATPILAQVVCTGDDCDNMTAGAAEIHIKYSITDNGL